MMDSNTDRASYRVAPMQQASSTTAIWRFLMIQQSRIQEPPRAEIVPEAIVAARVEEYRAPAGVIGRASWGAILAGTVTAIASQIVLTVLGLAIGLTVVDPSANQQGFGLGAGIWWLITGLVSLFLGGLVT